MIEEKKANAHLIENNDLASALPKPEAKIETTPVEFTGSGKEYFRIWIVNLLLILVTFGIYLPWAKVRKIRYFYNNTQIDGHALDFHGEPRKMLRGTMLAGIFLALYSQAMRVSEMAGAVAIVAVLLVWPPLYRAAMKFRLANTSWRGMRFRLEGASLKDAYLTIGLLNALILVPFLLLGFVSPGNEKEMVDNPILSRLMGLFTIGYLLLPYFMWAIAKYRIAHSAWGPLKMEFRADAGSVYVVYLKTIGISMLTMFVAVVLIGVYVAIFMAGSFKFQKPSLPMIVALLPMIYLSLLLIYLVPFNYLGARMQNLVWSRTGNNWLRFKSELSAKKYILLQLKNYFLIFVTLGLYWPFAVIASKKMQIEAVSLKTRVPIAELSDAARARENDALGDAAADMFDMNIGL